MKLFIDTSKKNKIREYQELGIIQGCTTNPKIIAQDGVKQWKNRLEEISKIVEGPISAEVTTNQPQEMIKQARELSKISENINVKIPANKQGFKAASELENVEINMTACMSPNQVFLAEKVGADYASIFMGRISDMGYDPSKVIEKSQKISSDSTEIIIGSIRKVYDIQEAFLSGADIVTTPPKYLDEMIEHQKTKESVDEFLESADFK